MVLIIQKLLLPEEYFYSTDSPKFSPRQMSTPMSTRGPQGQVQIGKYNQPYQHGSMNQTFQGSLNNSMLPQNQYQQTMMSPPLNQSSFVGNLSQQREPNFPMQMEFSAKHNGVYIYVGRILSSIWNLNCVFKSEAPDNKQFVSIFV